jgi:hypothetical protein
LTDGTPSDAGSDAEHESPAAERTDGAPDAGPTPRKRRRRRGRGRHGGDTSSGEPREAAPPPRATTPTAAAPPPAPVPKAFATLAAGLFSHIDDRQVPCKMDGCDRTWTWSAAEQIQAFGQPPPRRMCAEHYALHHAVLQNASDREVRCSNPWCERTWTWPKSVQLALLQRNPRATNAADLEPPSRPCDTCTREERELADAEIACRVDGCKRTWTWSRDAQLKHRAWLKHAPQLDRGRNDDQEDERRGRRRRRRRGAKSPADPPPRMCEPCRQRLGTLVDREGGCKVHGCTRTVTIDRESQLRAWAALGTTALDVEAPLPKRMCEVCREFCRLHSDREVPCGRPGCDRTWTYKTGAQLQAFLAGRFEDPLRLCETCMSGAAAHDLLARQDGTEVAPEGAESMPCVVIGCDGVWYWIAGMSIAPANDGDQPLDRMCARCRAERGQAPDVHELHDSSDDSTVSAASSESGSSEAPPPDGGDIS